MSALCRVEQEPAAASRASRSRSTVWQMWRRLPAPVRARVYREARVQGPKVMRAAQHAVQEQLNKRK